MRNVRCHACDTRTDGRTVESRVVFSFAESAKDDFDSEYIGVDGSLMINIAFMPLYM